MAWVVTAVAAALEVGATFAVIATAVAEVGIAMTVVGTITKSKELVKVGGFLSLAGGVASLGAAAVGAIGGEAAAGAAIGGAAGDAGIGAGMDAAAAEATNAAVAGGVDAAAGSAITTPIAAPVSVTNGGAGLVGGSADAAASTAAPAAADAGLSNVQSGVSTPDFLKDFTVSADPAGSAADALSTTVSSTKPGLGQSVKDWYNGLSKSEQSRIGNTLLQMGGQAVGGLFSGWTADQKLQLEQQAQALNKQKFDTAATNGSAVPSIAFKAPTGLVGLAKTKV